MKNNWQYLHFTIGMELLRFRERRYQSNVLGLKKSIQRGLKIAEIEMNEMGEQELAYYMVGICTFLPVDQISMQQLRNRIEFEVMSEAYVPDN